ncbi:hypothetical protein V1264_013467 [Littorina saxatilis]|uniref:Clarin-3 n=2 Tax=Littorina saxatilis TaxID=31220 RepID=A0AAN9BN83_9CAEN
MGVVLLVTAFATDYWVTASPQSVTNNSTSDTPDTSNSSFGLFNGKQYLKYTTGDRSFPLQALCNATEGVCAYIFLRQGTEPRAKLTELIQEYKKNGTASSGLGQIEHGLFSFALWVCTIIFLSLSIVMGLVTIGFSVFNVFGRPIETITGPMGLYLWNGLSLLLTILTLSLFGALYGGELSQNFLMFEDYKIGWRSEGHTSLGYSYFLVIGGAGAFIVNLILLYLSGHTLSCSYAGSGEKEVDNGMILY